MIMILHEENNYDIFILNFYEILRKVFKLYITVFKLSNKNILN